MVVVESSSNYYSVLQHLLPTIGDDDPHFIQNQLFHSHNRRKTKYSKEINTEKKTRMIVISSIPPGAELTLISWSFPHPASNSNLLSVMP